MSLMFISATATFIYLITSFSTHDPRVIAFDNTPTLAPGIGDQPADGSWLSYLQSNVSLLTIFWIVGATICSLRLIGSWWYVSQIRAKAVSLDQSFITRLDALISRLQIKQRVMLATSSYVTAPAVIGWIKPTILIPVGFLSGLSTQQVETILIHELMHIKRHDYLINLVQSWLECILFFNPFVWMVSSIIRTEREHCCDDAVIAMGNAKVYALTLAQLESRRLSATNMAISLAENKNQLLNRIKRIMEKSVRNYSGREKLIPVTLLIIGLVCASWITFQSKEKTTRTTSASPADTTGKKNIKSGSMKRVITVDANGEVTEETLQNLDHHVFAAVPVAPAPEGIAPITAIPDIEFDIPMAPFPPASIAIFGDTIPPAPFPRHDWEAFSEAFEGKFKEQFQDFYKNHQKDFDEMMNELEEKFKESGEWNAEFQATMAMRADEIRQHAAVAETHAEAMALRSAEMARHAEHMKEFTKEMEVLEKEHALRAKEMEAAAKKMEENMKRFEGELQDALVKDGYLGKDEKIKNIHWHNDELEVNDIKIKKEHQKKYNDLHKKYFKDHGEMHYVD
jgi:beta-lactamase regulating signal transducer with metallopeptidase domain